MSLQLFFMASYDIDRIRRSVLSDSFQNGYDLGTKVLSKLETDDIALMRFGMHFLKQVLLAEITIPERKGR